MRQASKVKNRGSPRGGARRSTATRPPPELKLKAIKLVLDNGFSQIMGAGQSRNLGGFHLSGTDPADFLLTGVLICAARESMINSVRARLSYNCKTSEASLPGILIVPRWRAASPTQKRGQHRRSEARIRNSRRCRLVFMSHGSFDCLAITISSPAAAVRHVIRPTTGPLDLCVLCALCGKSPWGRQRPRRVR